MVDLQGDAGAQLERCGLVLIPATAATVVCCCHGWFGAAAVLAGREFSFQSPNDEWRLPVCDVSEMRVSTGTQSILDCACFTTAGRSPGPVFFSGLPPAGSGWLPFFFHSLFLNIQILCCCVFHLKVLLTQFALTLDHIDAEADVKSAAMFLIRGASVTSPPASSARLYELRHRCSKWDYSRERSLFFYKHTSYLPGNDWSWRTIPRAVMTPAVFLCCQMQAAHDRLSQGQIGLWRKAT